MKSRTSFFNGAVFKKDITRFAPVWALYSVLLLMVLVSMLAERVYFRADNIADMIPFMAVLNFGYGLLCAVLLFGDLFEARLCNALHAMPLRRECWFGTHLVSGLAFSVVPNVVAAALGLLMLNLGTAWSVALWWLLASVLQYLCFFGMAVFCVMLTGKRIACVMVYGLINFFALLVFWLVSSLYEPLLYGIRIPREPFTYFSPVLEMTENYNLVSILSERILDSNGDYLDRVITGVALGEGWGLLWAYGALGLGLLALALVMYRKRPLEAAGDFSVFRVTEPVFLILYTVTVGGFLHLFSDIFGTGGTRYLFLAIGLVVGFFTGLMLLQRTTRVFKPKAFLHLGIFTAVFALTLVLTWLDPIGFTRWVPDGKDVAKVNLSNRYSHYGYSEYDMDLTEEADILAMIEAHRYSIGRTADDEIGEYDRFDSVNFCVEYTLTDGTVRTRFYAVNVLSEAGQLLKGYFSSFPYITGYSESDIPELAGRIEYIRGGNTKEFSYDEMEQLMKTMDMEQLLRAIARDCAAGHMAQQSGYHMEAVEDVLYYGDITYLEIQLRADHYGNMEYFYLTVYEGCDNTLAWMVENGLYEPDAEPVYYQ